MFRRSQTDILILGAGGAGLLAALHAHQTNPKLKITLAVKGLLGKCGCTRMVQGGYNVALGEDDSVERHFMDTIAGGKWLPDQELAWKLCKLAITRVHELENEIGCFFDREDDGSLHHKAFAGQTADRTVHKGDLTGIEIINRLMEQVLALPIDKLQEYRALAMIPNEAGTALSGVLMVNMRNGEMHFVQAKAVLMATGGGPTMYKYYTPSGEKSMDGLAMAYRIGLPLRDMEMVQFHPTGLLAGEHTRMTGTVLEEGLRGAGGYLLNSKNERFMLDYDPHAERATRDIVSRGIYDQMRKGNTTPNGGVYISMNHLGVKKVRKKFKGMVKRCADCGFDLAADRVEVVPTAHYFMGGMVCDTQTKTSLKGLFVAGEDAGGVHGANRLGGNGVANSTVYGGVAGEEMASYLADAVDFVAPDEVMLVTEIERAMRPFTGEKHGNVHHLREQLMDVMWHHVGVLRTADLIKSGLEKIKVIQQQLYQVSLGEQDLQFNVSWHDWLNLDNLLEVSVLIAQAALSRENSRGAHFREDFPGSGSLQNSYFTVTKYKDGKLQVEHQAVQFTRVQPGETLIDD